MRTYGEEIDTNVSEREYIHFCKAVYRNDPFYRDSLSSLLRDILKKKGYFEKHADIQPVLIRNDGVIKVAAVFILVDRMPQVLQIAFFEAMEGCQAEVGLLLEEAKKRAAAARCRSIAIGLNGHSNYGLGFLDGKAEEVPCFGNSYNPPYYPAYFRGPNVKEHPMTSYLTRIDRYDFFPEEKILKRIGSRYSYRVADLTRLDREAALYNEINNTCFAGQPFYYESTLQQDIELFRKFSLFIRDENLIIAQYGSKPIGFMLWYPDFNQLIPRGGRMGIGTYLKTRLFPSRMDRFKIAEIAVLPEHQGTGAVAGLFNLCLQITRKRYTWCEAGWIMQDNVKSKGFGLRWANREYHKYCAFEMPL